MLSSQKNYSPSALLLVCMLSDVFIRPFYSAVKFNAKVSVVSTFITFALTLAIVILAALFFKNGFMPGKTVRVICGVFFLYNAAVTFIKAEQFYRYISSSKIPLLFMGLLFLAVAAYAVKMQQNSLLRVSTLAAGMCIISAFLIIFSNLANLKAENLSLNGSNEIIFATLLNISFAPEILLFFLISKQKTPEKLKSFTGVISLVVLIFTVLTICAELVMGQFYISLSQPAHTLSRLGGISVFKRLDAIFASVWLFASLIKFAAFFSFSAKSLLSAKKGFNFLIVCLVQAGFIATAYFTAGSGQTYILSGVTAALFFICASSKNKPGLSLENKYEKTV